MPEITYCYVCLGCNRLYEKDRPLDPTKEICEQEKCRLPLKQLGRVVDGKWIKGDEWPDHVPTAEESAKHKLRLI